MSQQSTTPLKNTGGPISKILDPVFVCMCTAVALAIGASVMLRILSGGPSTAQASDSDTRGEMIFPAEPKPPLSPQPAFPATRPTVR